jgi:dipeptidyl-peptidase-4
MRSLFAAVTVLLSLVTPTFSQQASSEAPLPAAEKRQLTIDDILREPAGNAVAPRFVEWSPDGRRISFVRTNSTNGRDEFHSVDPASGRDKVLIGAGPLASLMAPNPKLSERERENRVRYGTAAYHWAPDSKGLLFDAEGQLWFYNLQNGEATDLTGSASPASDPKFSPDGRYISFIRDHDLVVSPVVSGKPNHKPLHPDALAERKLTSSSASVWNGEADWLYQEELDVRSNYFWAPDARHIAYLQMDESAVPEYPIVDWIPRHVEIDRQQYPKAGETNPSVRIGVVDLDGHSKWLSFTTESDIYIPRFGWLNPQVVWALVLNRAQTRESLYFIDIESGNSRLALQETEDPYIEMNGLLRFFPSGEGFLWPSWRDGHTHLYLYDIDGANPLSRPAQLVRQLTRGDWEVLELCALGERVGAVYFTANKDDWRQSNLYRVNLDGTGLQRLTAQNGVHKPIMSPHAEYFFDSFSALTTPPRMQLCAMKPAAGTALPEDAQLRRVSGTLEAASCSEIWRSKELEEAHVLAPQFVDFKAEDGSLLLGVLLLPKSGPMAAGGKFPVILSLYGGPQVQLVRDRWRTISLLDQLMTQHGFAILKVDNRGTGNRGKKFAAASRENLGAVELKDQLAALDQALAKYPQLDRNRIGCWGWSFGGTLAAYALTHSTIFKAAVAVAPVTDWRLYDSIYTERYMGMPSQNPEGYRDSSILHSASELSGHLLIAHGTGDDNVHVQNSIALADALISAGRAFDLQFYPRKTHEIEGVAARSDLYHRIVEHFERWLAPAR